MFLQCLRRDSRASNNGCRTRSFFNAGWSVLAYLMRFFLVYPIVSATEITKSCSKDYLISCGVGVESPIAKNCFEYVFESLRPIDVDVTTEKAATAKQSDPMDTSQNRDDIWNTYGLGQELVKQMGAKRNSYCSLLRQTRSKCNTTQQRVNGMTT